MMDSPPGPYAELVDEYERYKHLEGASAVLQWDQYVTMPDEGAAARSEQLSTLSSLTQRQLTGSRLGGLLDDVDEAALSERRRAVVREIRREYERATRVPERIEAELSELRSAAHSAWNEAREADDFDVFAPHFEALVEKKREYANAVDPDAEPYETLVGEFFPQLEYETVERILRAVESELVPLLDRIRRSDVELDTDAIHGEYDDQAQLAAARELLDTLGYDWKRGRLDSVETPFTLGFPSDARVCTSTHESLYRTLWTTAHEGGHAFYALGLPDEEYGTPLGEDRGTFVSEAEASFWECHVFGRRGFWETFMPTLTESIPDLEATAAEAYESVTHVRERNPVWMEADELTGQLHILLRFEIERDLVNGDLAVEDVPEMWNAKTEEYFDITPESLAEGCLQDVHWAQGNFGYFPTYTLGHVLAAQVAAAMERDLGDVDELLREGAFDAVLEWHRDTLHRHGQRYTTPELIRRATGDDLSADSFVDYVTGKYADLYGLS